MCTKTLPRAFLIIFPLPGTFVSWVSDNVIFLGFLWISHVRQRKKDIAREKREKQERGYGSRACGKAPTTERTIYDVSPRNTLISNVSHRFSHLHHRLPWSWRYRIGTLTLFDTRIVRACEHECSEADVNPRWLAMDIWNTTDSVGRLHRE